jgi:hypothetical protein
MLNVDAATVIDSDTDAVCTGDPLSLTDTVNVALPAPVGVPEITPALESASPAGKLPEATDHVYPGVPPLALSETAYAEPTLAAPSVTEFATSVVGACVAGTTTIESVTLFC